MENVVYFFEVLIVNYDKKIILFFLGVLYG